MARPLRKKPLIGFIGQGFIGKNYADDFEQRGYKTIRYSLEEPYIKNKDKIKDCEFVFIAVPTPTVPADASGEGGRLASRFDASIVRAAVALVGVGKTAVVKSTIVPGTTRKIQEEFPDRIVFYSPEFLSEATAAHDAAHPFSNIVGLTDTSPKQKQTAEKLHAVLPPAPFSLTCTSTEAEIIKYSHNGSGYAQIIFFNLMFDFARKHGANWRVIQHAIEADPLISNRYARPVHKSGRGAGGHCFIKDVAALRVQYEKELDDSTGLAFFESMERKNIELLRSSGKDLDLLSDVYGEQVLEGAVRPEMLPDVSSVRGEIELLVCTEKIDRTDPLLGFFHRWIGEFARHSKSVHVIALGYGERDLPANVREHSLGKESARGARWLKRALYSIRFLRYAIRYRKQYREVLVHLTPEYFLLTGVLWRLWGKRVAFWYNDSRATWMTRVAIALSDIVFYSNPESYAARFPNGRMVPMGVDTQMYGASTPPHDGSLLYLGRIAPQKRLDLTLAAVAEVARSDKPARLDLYGTPWKGDEAYAAKLRSTFSEFEKRGIIKYHGGVVYEKTPEIYASHDIFLHLGSLRGFNKTLLEAMAAGNLVITSDSRLRGVIDERLFVEKPNAGNVAKAILAARHFSAEEREREMEKMQSYVRREHALSSVVPAMLEMLRREGGEGSN